MREVYQASVRLAKDAAHARDRVDKKPAEAEIGKSFERAVAVRVHTWLDQANHPAVQSAWRRVCVAPEGWSEKSAEFDVLLVLKNGILWHLECKSAADRLKDLDARILNLQKASSQLARLALCVPILTRHAAEPWFAALHEQRERIEYLKRAPFVPFTMPNQPASYTLPARNDGAVLWNCPDLESQLEKCLKPFASF